MTPKKFDGLVIHQDIQVLFASISPEVAAIGPSSEVDGGLKVFSCSFCYFSVFFLTCCGSRRFKTFTDRMMASIAVRGLYVGVGAIYAKEQTTKTTSE